MDKAWISPPDLARGVRIARPIGGHFCAPVDKLRQRSPLTADFLEGGPRHEAGASSLHLGQFHDAFSQDFLVERASFIPRVARRYYLVKVGWNCLKNRLRKLLGEHLTHEF